jgi:hypothetical protein
MSVRPLMSEYPESHSEHCAKVEAHHRQFETEHLVMVVVSPGVGP